MVYPGDANGSAAIFIQHAIRGQRPRDTLLIPTLLSSDLYVYLSLSVENLILYLQFGDFHGFRPGE